MRKTKVFGTLLALAVLSAGCSTAENTNSNSNTNTTVTASPSPANANANVHGNMNASEHANMNMNKNKNANANKKPYSRPKARDYQIDLLPAPSASRTPSPPQGRERISATAASEFARRCESSKQI